LLGLLLTLLVSSSAAFAQPISRDTSFSTHSAYLKARKQHPEISIARPVVPKGVRSSSALTYCTLPGGRALQLDVFYRPAKRQRPAVLIIHGGGWASGHREQHWPLAQQLAGRGFVAITAEYRLSGEAPYPAAVQDLKTALRWLRAHAHSYAIDTNRVAVWGFSAGGQLAALLGTTSHDTLYAAGPCHRSHSSQVQAVVDADGILAFLHPESGEGDDRKSLSAATRWFGAPKTERPELWEQASPLRHVDIHTPPMLFLNSAVDRMHAGRDDLRQQLDSLGIYSEAHTFPNTPHSFVLFNPWFEPVLNYTVAFLNRVFGTR